MINASGTFGGGVNAIEIIRAEKKDKFVVLGFIVEVLNFCQKARGEEREDAAIFLLAPIAN